MTYDAVTIHFNALKLHICRLATVSMKKILTPEPTSDLSVKLWSMSLFFLYLLACLAFSTYVVVSSSSMGLLKGPTMGTSWSRELRIKASLALSGHTSGTFAGSRKPLSSSCTPSCGPWSSAEEMMEEVSVDVWEDHIPGAGGW